MRAPVERAGPAVIGPRALQLDVLADDPHQIRGVAHLLDHVVGDHAQARNSTIVTPAPPWFGGAKAKRFTRASCARMPCTSLRTAPVPFP